MRAETRGAPPDWTPLKCVQRPRWDGMRKNFVQFNQLPQPFHAGPIAAVNPGSGSQHFGAEATAKGDHTLINTMKAKANAEAVSVEGIADSALSTPPTEVWDDAPP